MVGSPGERDLLQLLANPTNRTILSVLWMEPQYPRRLAELVGLTEDEASRRLRTFEKLGLAEGTWANVGKNVRLYKLATNRFTVSVGAEGLTVSGLPDDRPVSVGAVAEMPPTATHFVGRDRELAEIGRQLATRRAVCLTGIGGTGKTALAAAFTSMASRPVVWHTLAPGESGTVLLGRLAANVRTLVPGEQAQRILALMGAEDEALLISALLETLNEKRALLVLDRFDGAGEDAAEISTEFVRRATDARILLTSRTFPAGLPRDLVSSYRLQGLEPGDTQRLLDAYGARPDPEFLNEIQDRTHGHPLALVLVAQLGEERRVAGVERLMAEAGIRDFLVDDVLPQLGESERDLLFAVSVLRHPFLAEEAEAISESKHARHNLLKLEGRGLVVRAGDTYLLHDLLRTFAAHAAPHPKQLHARAAKVLKGSGEPAKALEALHHYLEAGAVSDAGALLRDELVHRTYRFAENGLGPRYRDGLERIVGHEKADGPTRGAAELELALLDTYAGEATHARPHLEAASKLLHTGPAGFRVPLLMTQARLLRLEGRTDEAAATLQEAEEVAVRSKATRAQLEAILERAFMEEEHNDVEAFRTFQRGLRLAEQLSDVRLLSLAYSGAARIGMRQGDDRHLSWAEEALRLARLAGYLRGEVSVYMTLTTFAMMRGEMAPGLEYSDRYLAVASKLGDPWLKACALSDRAMFLVSTHTYDEAVRLGRETLALAEKIKSPFYEFAARVIIAEALAGLDRVDEAVEVLKAAFALKVEAWPAMVARGWRVYADVLGRAGKAREADRAAREAKAWSRRRTATDVSTEWESFQDAQRAKAAPQAASRARPRKVKR